MSVFIKEEERLEEISNEIRAILKKHDLAGAVVIMSKRGVHVHYNGETSWTYDDEIKDPAELKKIPDTLILLDNLKRAGEDLANFAERGKDLVIESLMDSLKEDQNEA